VRVYGHPRSGNHLLADLLHRALLDSDPEYALKVDRRKVAAAGRTPCYAHDGELVDTRPMVVVPYGRLLGSHRRTPVPDAVYVIRDGRDVARSVLRSWPVLSQSTEPAPKSLELMLAQRRDWGSLMGASPFVGTFLQHWRAHVAAWRRSARVLVFHASLVESPGSVALDVARAFGLRAPRAPVQLPAAVGWDPNPKHLEIRRHV